MKSGFALLCAALYILHMGTRKSSVCVWAEKHCYQKSQNKGAWNACAPEVECTKGSYFEKS